jgi:hypothetical protein
MMSSSLEALLTLPQDSKHEEKYKQDGILVFGGKAHAWLGLRRK